MTKIPPDNSGLPEPRGPRRRSDPASRTGASQHQETFHKLCAHLDFQAELNELSRDRLTMVTMYYSGKLSFAEVGRMLAVPAGYVETCIREFEERLREQ